MKIPITRELKEHIKREVSEDLNKLKTEQQKEAVKKYSGKTETIDKLWKQYQALQVKEHEVGKERERVNNEIGKERERLRKQLPENVDVEPYRDEHIFIRLNVNEQALFEEVIVALQYEDNLNLKELGKIITEKVKELANKPLKSNRNFGYNNY